MICTMTSNKTKGMTELIQKHSHRVMPMTRRSLVRGKLGEGIET